jgi:hypothetical protein
MDVMTTIIGEKLRKVKLLSDSLAWYDSLDFSVREKIVKMIQEDQLLKRGVDADGDIIGLYSRATELMSGGKKREGDPFNLFDTGEFFRSMFVIVLRDSFLVDGDTKKMEESFSQTNGWWWRDEILGLTDENLDKLKILLRERYIQYARKVLEIN